MFALVVVRRCMRVKQGTLVSMMRVRTARRRVHVRVRQHEKTHQHGENGKHRSQETHHSVYRSASFRVCQAPEWPAAILAGMNSINVKLLAAVALVGALGLNGVAIAHEVTHTGTVIALKTAKYAQPDGGSREVRELEVTVVDPKTKKPSNRVFTITDKTRLVRAGKRLKAAELTAQKGEKVAVVVNHDKPGDAALEIRFEAAA